MHTFLLLIPCNFLRYELCKHYAPIYILDRPNSIELSPCDFQPLRFLPRFASLSLLTGGVFANILTISVKPLSSFDGFAFWSFSDLL